MRLLAIALALALPALASSSASADGCYLCQGAGTYVKFSGEDTWDKRHKAEACGCKVQGTTSSCAAAGNKILCSVAALPSLPGARSTRP